MTTRVDTSAAPTPPSKDSHSGMATHLTACSKPAGGYAFSRFSVGRDDGSQRTPSRTTAPLEKPLDYSRSCSATRPKPQKCPVPATSTPEHLVDFAHNGKHPPLATAKLCVDEASHYADSSKGARIPVLLRPAVTPPTDPYAERQAFAQGPDRAPKLPLPSPYTTSTQTSPGVPNAANCATLVDFRRRAHELPAHPEDGHFARAVRACSVPTTTFDSKAANAHRSTGLSSYVRIPSRSDLQDAERELEEPFSSRERSRSHHHRAIPSSSLRHDLPWLLRRRAFVEYRPGTPHPERSRTRSNAYGEREAFCDPRPPSQRTRS